MKPIDAFQRLISSILLLDRWKRPENKAPGRVVESMPPEIREGLSNLKSDEIGGDKVRVEDYYTMGDDWETRQKLLEIEKKMGIQPPPRKKYDEHG
jgi:hypothetical protein